MSQTVEVEPYEEIVEAVHYNTPVGSRSSSPQDSPRRSSPHLFLSNDPIQRNSMFAAPARPALGSTELAISEPWRGSATISCLVPEIFAMKVGSCVKSTENLAGVKFF